MDTFPFNVDQVSISGKADWAKMPVIGGIKPGEFMGDGGNTINLSGQLLPIRIGGLSELEIADKIRKTGQVFPVMRGDGKPLGNYFIKSTKQTHKELERDGVPFVISYQMVLEQEPDETPTSPDLIPDLVSIFDLL
ncbi:phage tail protein [Pseudovibrio brasiliensis]|uniref:Phage tail protein n=1 Tax=Pseudovibrio brasiliensis TaxID=1898042 RepID=A0ABX8AVP2_9HYPH|nr:phage tail protein [Pseudovibrio brasiliensis]QUS57766.1 phage tail protein [Pseudovibrio brasiliensis]